MLYHVWGEIVRTRFLGWWQLVKKLGAWWCLIRVQSFQAWVGFVNSFLSLSLSYTKKWNTFCWPERKTGKQWKIWGYLCGWRCGNRANLSIHLWSPLQLWLLLWWAHVHPPGCSSLNSRGSAVVLAGLWGLALRWNCQHVQKLRGSQDLWPLQAAEFQETCLLLLSSGKMLLSPGPRSAPPFFPPLTKPPLFMYRFLHIERKDQVGGQYSAVRLLWVVCVLWGLSECCICPVMNYQEGGFIRNVSRASQLWSEVSLTLKLYLCLQRFHKCTCEN